MLIAILAFAALLRIWRVDQVPVSLFGDEIDMGYHAYSLMTSGRDYMGNLFPIHLQSIADYKSSLLGYSLIPGVALFGITPLGLRLPIIVFSVISIWVLYLLVIKFTEKKSVALLSAFLLATSPWHIHYSRWSTESMEMLLLFMVGVLFFLKGLRTYWLLIVSAIFFALTIWAYHAAKLFVPMIVLSIAIIWFNQLRAIPRKFVIGSIGVFLLIALPVFLSTFFGKGGDRFQSTSIFNDPSMEYQVGESRSLDNMVNNQTLITDKLFHNKFIILADEISTNYLNAFSPQFLFIDGDPNPRHSIPAMGNFYKYQIIFLLIGAIVFFSSKSFDIRYKALVGLWLLIAPLTPALTKDGGFHSIRLIFMLPPLIFLIATGMYGVYTRIYERLKSIYIVVLILVGLISFMIYQHDYWVHYPWETERWWQSGTRSAIKSITKENQNFPSVIISNANEPMLLFFLGWSEYSPERFRQQYPLTEEDLVGFGKVSILDKYKFTPIGKDIGLYDLPTILPENTLFLATAKEIGLDLIKEPERVPEGIKLLKSIKYPSGVPAFYLFSK